MMMAIYSQTNDRKERKKSGLVFAKPLKNFLRQFLRQLQYSQHFIFFVTN